MQILISERTDITPLPGIDWLIKFKLNVGKIRVDENSQSGKRRVICKFSNNTTNKDAEINIQLKQGCYPVTQKPRPIPLHIQEAIGKELEKLTKSGHLVRVKQVDDDCFVSLLVVTVKSNKLKKPALDSRKLKYCCITTRPYIPKVDELLNRISADISIDRTKKS